MTKTTFTKAILRVSGVISLILSSMIFYSGITLGVPLGIAGLVLGAGLFVLSVVIGRDKEAVSSKAKTIGRSLGVILTTLVLHSLGIVAMVHIHWLLGVALMLIGIGNLLFLSPATRGFAEEN